MSKDGSGEIPSTRHQDKFVVKLKTAISESFGKLWMLQERAGFSQIVAIIRLMRRLLVMIDLGHGFAYTRVNDLRRYG